MFLFLVFAQRPFECIEAQLANASAQGAVSHRAVMLPLCSEIGSAFEEVGEIRVLGSNSDSITE